VSAGRELETWAPRCHKLARFTLIDDLLSYIESILPTIRHPQRLSELINMNIIAALLFLDITTIRDNNGLWLLSRVTCFHIPTTRPTTRHTKLHLYGNAEALVFWPHMQTGSYLDLILTLPSRNNGIAKGVRANRSTLKIQACLHWPASHRRITGYLNWLKSNSATMTVHLLNSRRDRGQVAKKQGLEADHTKTLTCS
jgi:hypothetical protein